jgi:hypothetical protein
MENATRTENWHRFKIKGKLVSEGVNDIYSMKTCLPICGPVMIFASITLL